MIKSKRRLPTEATETESTPDAPETTPVNPLLEYESTSDFELAGLLLPIDGEAMFQLEEDETKRLQQYLRLMRLRSGTFIGDFVNLLLHAYSGGDALANPSPTDVAKLLAGAIHEFREQEVSARRILAQHPELFSGSNE